MIFTDRGRNVVRWSKGAEQITGWAEAEVLGRSADLIFTPEDREAGVPEAEQGEALKEGRAEGDRWHLRKDGTRFFGSGVMVPLSDPDTREPRGFAKVLRDLTEQKRLEGELRASSDSLRASEERFRAFVTASSEVVYRVSPDWSEMLQLEGRGLVRDTVAPSGSWMDEYVHPDDRARVREAIRRAIRAKAVYEQEHRVWKSDGTLGWTLSRAVPLLDGRGEIVEWFGAAADISDRKRAEDALRESEERLRTLSDAVPQLIWASAPGGEATYFNRRWYEYTGLTEGESLIAGWQAALHPDDAPAVLEAWRRRVAEGAVFEAECRLRGAGGSYRWFIARGVPLLDAAGRATAWFGSATDVQELRELREGLEARVRERTAALADALADLAEASAGRRALLGRVVSAQEEERRRISRELHDEMGQLLTGFSLGLKSLEGAVTEHCPSGSGAQTTLERMRALAEAMGREVHRIAVELRPTSLDDVGLVPALEAYCLEWQQRTGVPVEFAAVGLGAGVGRLPPVLETTAYRVVQEALNNAAKYACGPDVPAGAGATGVSVTLHRGGGELRATVEDDGPGFDPEEAASRGRLGIAGMRERAELAGGTLEVESAPGEGTTVFLRVPAHGPAQPRIDL